MKMIFVVLGLIPMVAGTIIIPFGFMQEHRQSETWDLAATQVGMSSFSAHLSPGYHRFRACGGVIYHQDPSPYLEIWDSSGNRIYRFKISQYDYRYFTIATSDDYHFYIYKWLLTEELEVEIERRSYESKLAQPYTGLVAIGIVVFLAGLGTSAYGLIAKPALKESQAKWSKHHFYFCHHFMI